MTYVLIPEMMDESAVAKVAAAFDTYFDPQLLEDRPALFARIGTADGLIVRNRTGVDAELLSHAPRLKVVGRLGVGLDNIDLEACAARGIRVIPATGGNAQAVAEHVMAVMMILLRPVYLYGADTLAGQWPRARYLNTREIGGKTLGLVGFGATGQLVARLAAAFGLRVLACGPRIRPGSRPAPEVEGVDLDTLLARADIVSLHLPYTPQTHHLLDSTRIARMKQGALLINTARGGIVDEKALVAALHAGHLGGAALDVFESEPLPAGSLFCNVPNLLVTPHTAGVSAEANWRVGHTIADAVIDYLQGSS